MIPRTSIPLDELEKVAEGYQPYTGEAIISFHSSSEPQREIIEVHLRPITVAEVRANQFTICRFSRVPPHIVKPVPKASLSAHQQDNVPEQSPPKRKRKRKQPLQSTDSREPIQNAIKMFLDKTQRGLKRLAQRNGSSLNKVGYDDIIELLQEKSASQINAVVNKLISHAGPLALVIYSILAETNYKWSAAREVEDKGIVEAVIAGLLGKGIEVPEQLELFNPVATLSWILQEDYQSLCQELGLANFSSLDPRGADGMIKELPLGPAMVQARLPTNVIRVPERGAWLLKAKENALQDGNPEKRQRQAVLKNGPCIGSDLHQTYVPTDDGGSADLRLRSNSFDDMLWENPENGEHYPCELCGIAMSSLGCSCNMPLPAGGAGVLFGEERFSMTNEVDAIQIPNYPELPIWLKDPAANMDSIILPLDSQGTINLR
ncbi:hypothetical protein PG994_003371 [Apiospora phragmitis]|uniref:Uncharacterized protein n=1 Tax=Apiospora phragmitis TaxID=2905665 RepID=A0ABR1W1S0_9PEZI